MTMLISWLFIEFPWNHVCIYNIRCFKLESVCMPTSAGKLCSFVKGGKLLFKQSPYNVKLF